MTDDLLSSDRNQANFLEDLARRLSKLERSQEQAQLQARLSPDSPLRMGGYPAGADVQAAGTSTPGQENLIASGAVTADSIAAGAVTVGALRDPIGSNLISNGGFEANGDTNPGDTITGWTPDDPTKVDTILLGAPHTGSYGLRIQQLVSVVAVRATTDYMPVAGSGRYRLRGWAKGIGGNSAGANAVLRVIWYDAAKAQISSHPNVATLGASIVWTQLGQIEVAPDTAAYAKVQVENGTSGAVNDALFFDDIEFYRADNDVSHASGNVVIDSTGITINNGKLTLRDEFAQTVMQAAGFSGSWAEYINAGLWNASFAYGTNGSFLGRGANCPYWTADRIVGTTATATKGSGFVQLTEGTTSSGSIQITSDLIAVRPGAWYSAFVEYGKNANSASTTVRVGVQFYGSDGVTSVGGAQFSDAPAFTTSDVLVYRLDSPAWQAPSQGAGIGSGTAYYARIYVRMLAGAIGALQAASSRIYGVGFTPTVAPSQIAGETWTSYTPTVGNGGTVTWTRQLGHYQKIGKMVFVRIYLQVNAAGSGAGLLNISTPSTPDRTSATARQVVSGHAEGLSANNGTLALVTFASGSGATWDRLRSSTNVDITGAMLSAGAAITLQGIYMEA